MQYIKKLIFGERTKGVPLPPPSFKTREITNRPTQDEWAKQMNFGSRYGHRGSFYNKTS